MTYVVDHHSDFVKVARPFLQALVEQTGESVTLAVEVDGAPVCVDIINTTRPFRRQTAPGRIIGDIASVHGKLFAAFKHRQRARQDHRRPSPPVHPSHDHRPAGMAEELEQVARDDVAFDFEGLYFGICAVGAPVRDQMGGVVAAISVVMPTGPIRPGRTTTVHRGGEGNCRVAFGVSRLEARRADFGGAPYPNGSGEARASTRKDSE